MIQKCFIILLLFGVSFVSVVWGTLSNNDRILVVVDEPQLYSSHSGLFAKLQGKNADDAELSLTSESGDYLYSQLVLLCPNNFGSSPLKQKHVVDFVDAGGNVILFTGPNYAESYFKLFEKFGCELDQPGSQVIDHSSYSSKWDSTFERAHSAVMATGLTNAPAVLSFNTSSLPIVFHGIGMGVFKKNELIFPVLWGSPSCYSFSPNSQVNELPLVSGEEAVMMAALQARNGARILLVGSTDICRDTLTLDHTLGNNDLCYQAVTWTMGERGILRTTKMSHHLLGTSNKTTTYRVKDHVEFSVGIEEWDGELREWKPFVVNDIQLEFIMLDPYIRQSLTRRAQDGLYVTHFQIPDVIGVYKFSVEYYRRGYSPLQVTETVSVRPFRHDEYERFILQAYPYYASFLSMLGGIFIFSILFLYGQKMTRFDTIQT
eukprot:jgi/Galph1/5403/GphlegSOOS_G4056.1